MIRMNLLLEKNVPKHGCTAVTSVNAGWHIYRRLMGTLSITPHLLCVIKHIYPIVCSPDRVSCCRNCCVLCSWRLAVRLWLLLLDWSVLTPLFVSLFDFCVAPTEHITVVLLSINQPSMRHKAPESNIKLCSSQRCSREPTGPGRTVKTAGCGKKFRYLNHQRLKCKEAVVSISW